MAKNIKELWPDFPTIPEHLSEFSVWTFKYLFPGRTIIQKNTYTFYENTLWKTMHPDSTALGADFNNVWVIRIDDSENIEGRLNPGWEEILNLSFPMFKNKHDAIYNAIQKLTETIESQIDEALLDIKAVKRLTGELKR